MAAAARPSSAPRAVVGLGLCVLDQLWVVDDDRLRARRTRWTEHARGPGGMVATALAQAARLGCPAHLLSVVGDDAAGREVLAALRGHGVSTRRVVRDGRHPTSVASVLVDRRTRDRRFVVADRRAVERDAPELDLAPIRRGRVLLLDGHFGRSALAAARRARAEGVPVVGDFCDARPIHRRLLPFVDHPIVPEEFVAAWGAGGPRETLRDLAERFGGSPVVTLGARGALAWLDGRAHRIPARRVRVRDTTGAGDVFHGAFAAGLAHGWDPLSSLHLAARAAARACTGLGGTARLLERLPRRGRVRRPGA
ncbi:MAG: carbohydrate kinase family protein [Myxococcota bacterium]